MKNSILAICTLVLVSCAQQKSTTSTYQSPHRYTTVYEGNRIIKYEKAKKEKDEIYASKELRTEAKKSFSFSGSPKKIETLNPVAPKNSLARRTISFLSLKDASEKMISKSVYAAPPPKAQENMVSKSILPLGIVMLVCGIVILLISLAATLPFDFLVTVLLFIGIMLAAGGLTMTIIGAVLADKAKKEEIKSDGM